MKLTHEINTFSAVLQRPNAQQKPGANVGQYWHRAAKKKLIKLNHRR